MEYEKLRQQLEFILLLSQGELLSVKEMAERSGLRTRTVYRLLDILPTAGLQIEKIGRRYRILPTSPWLDKVSSRLRFSREEALAIAQLLHSTPQSNTQLRIIREKLARIYDDQLLTPHNTDERTNRNIQRVHEALANEQIVILRNYVPLRSKPGDRYVEAHSFLPGNRDICAFDITVKKNRTFNLSRVSSVDIVDLKWSHRELHKQLKTDIFHFCDEETERVVLRLGVMAKSVLLDEYPQAEELLHPCDGEHWILEIDVCSFVGLGRFVMGLIDDIEVIDNEAFCQYLRERIVQAQKLVDNWR